MKESKGSLIEIHYPKKEQPITILKVIAVASDGNDERRSVMNAKIPDWQAAVLNIEEFQKLAVGRKYKYVSHDDKLKVIKIDTGEKDHLYEVDLDQCQTASACLDWIHQLHEKSWFDADRHEEFIDLFFKVIDVHL